jgi:hypothetical protein
MGYFEGIRVWFWRPPNASKPLTDAGFEVVPGGGIEPSTHGFSVRNPEFHNFLKVNNLLKRFSFHLGISG